MPLKPSPFALKRYILLWIALYCVFLVLLGFFFGSYYSRMMKARTESTVQAFPLILDSVVRDLADQESNQGQRPYAYWQWNENGSLVSSEMNTEGEALFIPPENYEKIEHLTRSPSRYLSDFVQRTPEATPYFYYAVLERETLSVSAILVDDWLTRLIGLLPSDTRGFIADRRGNGFYFDAEGTQEIDFTDRNAYLPVGSFMVRYRGDYYFFSRASFSDLTLIRLLPFNQTIPALFITAIIPFLVGLFVLGGVSYRLKRLRTEQESVFGKLLQEISQRAFNNGVSAPPHPNDPSRVLREKINEIVVENMKYEEEVGRLTRKSSLLSESIRDNYQSVTSVNRLLQKFAFSEDYTLPRAIDSVTNVILSTDQTVEKCVVYLNEEVVFQKGPSPMPETGNEEITIEQGGNKIRVLLNPSAESSERDFSIKQEVLLTFLYTTTILFQLKRETQLDPFTGLYRFEHFSRLVQIELDKAYRYKRRCSLAMTNLRNFRVINERYGLNTSNRFLATVSKVIRENIRQGDLAGHYSGDRFLIFFQETLKSDSRKKMERLKELIKQALPKDILPGQWDFEYGIAECQEGTLSFTELVTTAFNDMAVDRE